MNEQQYVMAIDEGTTSSRAIIFDHAGKEVAIAQKEFRQYFPQPGWVEHDAEEIWDSVQSVISEAVIKAQVKPYRIVAIGITNQRETTVIWDRKTGKPIARAIVWQSKQTAPIAERLIEEGYTDQIHQKTGLVIDSYFSATKIKWLLDNVPGARERAKRGDLLFGTIDTWLLWNLTSGRVHATDVTNASRTMLFNRHFRPARYSPGNFTGGQAVLARLWLHGRLPLLRGPSSGRRDRRGPTGGPLWPGRL